MCFTRQLAILLWFQIVWALAAIAAAQDVNVAEIQPHNQRLAGWRDCVHQYGQAVMLVGDPGHSQATAFVISSKNRLLVTNAHVADAFYPRGDDACPL